MPWMIVNKGEEFCVYKQDDNKRPVGDPVGCHETHDKAVTQLRALYVNVKESVQPITASTEIVVGSIRFEADADNPRFLRFHDAVLARAETNANRDNINDNGVSELAATISGTPIDHEHNPTQNIGFYTAGRNVDGVLHVDGVVWLDRCEALGIDPTEIESGAYKLSIEATA